MSTGSHADPTAWTAIANVDRERKKKNRPRRRNKQHAHSQVGVYRDNAHATTDKHPHIRTLVRPENISLRARIKYYEQKTASVKSMAPGQKNGMGPGSEK